MVGSTWPPPPRPDSALNMPGQQKQMRPSRDTCASGELYRRRPRFAGTSNAAAGGWWRYGGGEMSAALRRSGWLESESESVMETKGEDGEWRIYREEMDPDDLFVYIVFPSRRHLGDGDEQPTS
ncbi:uncharacterized protein [Zea mays]|uniref:Uncharacterized protein n=1 Tax=Zea mays TaxID=4577 RepID=B4FQA3_MAIZE|nr:uncharacterized protein LOC118473567 [Zea mays]ACF84296.1 unknown [Zea mays]